MGIHRKEDNNIYNGRKEISYSEPLPSSRFQKLINNADYPTNISRDMNKHQLTKAYNKNQDLLRYIKEIEEMENPYSFSLPLLRTKTDSDFKANCEFSKYSPQTISKNNFYQTCFVRNDSNETSITDNQITLPCYKNYTLEYPLNIGTDSCSSFVQRPINFQDSPTLQPPKRKFIQCLPESVLNGSKRGLSIDTSSVLSSETDSDFTFYPCSRQFQESICLERQSDISQTICALPSQLEDPDSPFPPYRNCNMGNSLEDFSRQFYLEDDALSDDVFVDDFPFSRSNEVESYERNRIQSCYRHKSSPFDTSLTYQFDNMTILDIPNNYSQNDNINMDSLQLNETPSRSVALQRREERLHSLTLVITGCERKGTESSSILNINDGGIQINNEPAQNLNSPQKKKISESELEDFDLSEYNLNLANAFDSLRRNSMQTKSRRVWKERRTKMRRSTLFNVKTTAALSDGMMGDGNTRHSPKSSVSLSSENDNKLKYDSSNTNQVNNNKVNDKKPLRGILKNKNAVYPIISACFSTKVPDIESGDGIHDTECQDGIYESSCQKGFYDYTDKDIKSPKIRNNNKYCSATKVYKEHPSVSTQPKPWCNDGDNESYGYNQTCYTGYSLDSRGGVSNRRKLQRSSRVLSSPPLRRKVNEPIKKHSPTFVSVGVQVNLLG